MGACFFLYFVFLSIACIYGVNYYYARHYSQIALARACAQMRALARLTSSLLHATYNRPCLGEYLMVHLGKKRQDPTFFSERWFSSQNRDHHWGHREVAPRPIRESGDVFARPRIRAIQIRPPIPDFAAGWERNQWESLKINENT